jgi:hypothetical protein
MNDMHFIINRRPISHTRTPKALGDSHSLSLTHTYTHTHTRTPKALGDSHSLSLSHTRTHTHTHVPPKLLVNVPIRMSMEEGSTSMNSQMPLPRAPVSDECVLCECVCESEFVYM